jgi:hypothetical protein
MICIDFAKSQIQELQAIKITAQGGSSPFQIMLKILAVGRNKKEAEFDAASKAYDQLISINPTIFEVSHLTHLLY